MLTSGMAIPQQALDDDRLMQRTRWIRRGLHLSILSVAWNIIEGTVALASGAAAGSVALVSFGIDSFIETASAVVVGWRFSYEMHGKSEAQAEKAEAWAGRVTGTLLLALAVFILLESGRRFLGIGREPEPSGTGIALTVISLIVMIVLRRAKLRAAEILESKALRADAYETTACAWLSATTLGGLVLNALLGWWWADPLAAIALLPFILREGLEGVRAAERCNLASRKPDTGLSK